MIIFQAYISKASVKAEKKHRIRFLSQHAAAIGLCDIFRGNGMIEAIDDADGLRAFVGDDLCGAEEGVGHGIAAGVLLGASDEEEDDAAGFSLGKIALSCLGLGRGGGLALPVEEVAIDGVVFVEGGIGEFFLRFIECHEEDVCRPCDGVTVRMVEVFHAFANAGGLGEAEGCEELVARVAIVDFEGTGIGKLCLLGNDIDAVIEEVEQFADLFLEGCFFRKTGDGEGGVFRAVLLPIGKEGDRPHAQVFLFHGSGVYRQVFIGTPQEGYPSRRIYGEGAAHGSAESFFEVGHRERGKDLGVHEESRIGARAIVEDGGLYLGRAEEIGEGRPAAGGSVEFFHHLDVVFIFPKAAGDVFEYPFLCLLFELNGAAFRYVRKSFLDLFLDDDVMLAEERCEAAGEVILAACLCDEVEDGEAVFPFRKAQAAPELLEEDGHAVRRS